MALLVPYYVYGTVTVDGSNQKDATVAIGAANTTTNTNGLYQLNIQDVATDGASVTVTATYSGDSKQDSFTLDISDPFKEMDLAITTTTISVEGFSIYGTNPIKIYGTKPLTIYG